jgi:glyoxylate reductase
MASGKKPLVVVTRRLPDSVEMRMRELFDARLNADDKPMSQADLLAAAKIADVIVPTVTDHIDRAVLSQAGEKLKLIANFGNGVDNIDVATAVQRGITVTNTPGVLTEDTADMTMALILAVPRRLAEGAQVLTGSQEWGGWSPTWMLGHRIGGKRLGIVGMGRIGQAVARRGKGFDMRILYHDAVRAPEAVERELGAELVSAERLLGESDFVSLHVPLLPHTRHMMGADQFRRMKPTAILVNTSRGPVLDEAALAEALEKRVIAGAGIDVFENEPQVHPALLKLDNVVLAPHIASASVDTRRKMSMMAAENAVAALEGNRPTNLLNPEAWAANTRE